MHASSVAIFWNSSAANHWEAKWKIKVSEYHTGFFSALNTTATLKTHFTDGSVKEGIKPKWTTSTLTSRAEKLDKLVISLCNHWGWVNI